MRHEILRKRHSGDKNEQKVDTESIKNSKSTFSIRWKLKLSFWQSNKKANSENTHTRCARFQPNEAKIQKNVSLSWEIFSGNE
jgi:hypothetical protein